MTRASPAWAMAPCALLAASLGACAPPAPPPAVLTLTVTAGADQNPNASGQPTPVAVHIYQLTATTKFERAEAFALLEREQAALGDELSGSDTLVLAPQESKTITKALKPGVQAVGAAVAFRMIDRAAWRASAPVAAQGPSVLELRTAALAVTLGAVKPDAVKPGAP